MKTFDEISRKFFMPDDTSDGSEFVIPECWNPKTYFQSFFLNQVLNNASEDDYSSELLTAIGNCIDDFWEKHTINKTEIIFDGNLNFTVTTENSETIAESASFALGVSIARSNVFIDGTQIPLSEPGDQNTGMRAALIKDKLDSSKYSITLSNVDADTFANGEHHVLLSYVIDELDIKPKTYKELLFADAEDVIINNKMLPKTPEELAFALLNGIPVEFSSDSSEKP